MFRCRVDVTRTDVGTCSTYVLYISILVYTYLYCRLPDITLLGDNSHGKRRKFAVVLFVESRSNNTTHRKTVYACI